MKIGQDWRKKESCLLLTLLLLSAFVICLYVHFTDVEGHYMFLVLAFLFFIAFLIGIYREFKHWQKQNQEVKLAGTNNEGIA